MKSFLLLILLSLPICATSQINSLDGFVLEIIKNNPLEYAVVTLLTENDSLISGCLTDEKGYFQLKELPISANTLKINYLGFTERRIILDKSISGKLKMGKIYLEPNKNLLKEIEIEAEKSSVLFDIDKRTYNVEKDLAATGGTSLDALKNIPGITVGVDNSVKLRNQSPTIFIDGRPTLLSLDQIPADEIDKIELITNPSAKYVADATGGILNIILKKNLKPGYWGQINAATGNNNRNSLSGSLSIRERKMSVQLSGNYNTAFNNNNGYSKRSSFDDNVLIGSFDIENLNVSNRYNASGRIIFDFELNKKTSLRVSYSRTPNSVISNENQNFEIRNGQDVLLTDGFRFNSQTNNWKTHWGSINFRKGFDKEDKELTSDITIIASSNRNNSRFDNFLNLNDSLTIPLENQKNLGRREADYIVWQLDYALPLKKSLFLETGIRAAYKQSFSAFEVFVKQPSMDAFQADSNLSNFFRVDDFVGASYVNLKGKIGQLGWQAGLRYEHTYFVAEEQVTREIFSYIFPKDLSELDKAIFPALYLSRKLAKNNTLQLNFSRKIQRPEYMQLIPFITYADRQIVQIGNPVLAPSFVNIAEFNHSISVDKFNMLSGLYYRKANGAITSVIYPSITDPDILISTFENGRDEISIGLENSLKKTLFKDIQIIFNSNLFYTDISLEQNSILVRNEGWSWNGKAMLQIPLFDKLNFQINGSYESPRIIPQGNILELWYCDFSASWNINKSWRASFTLSDMFNSKIYKTQFRTESLIQETSRRWEVRFFRVNLTWKFGEPGKSIFNRQNRRFERDPGNKGTEMQEL